MHHDYYTGLYLSWAVRGVFLLSVIAIMASLTGCGHTLNTTSSGTLTKEPSQSTNPPIN